MKDISVLVFLVALVFGGFFSYMSYSCATTAEIEGYSKSKIVGFKCYGSKNGYNWSKVWF